MFAGYHAAGLLYHDPVFVVQELAAMGFESIVIRPHAASLNPDSPQFGQQVLRMGDAIVQAGIRCVLDLDSPYLPDPRSFRGPSLASANKELADQRQAWIARWIDLSKELSVELITFSSGIHAWGSDPEAGGERDETMLERLSKRLSALCEQASKRDVGLALHPRYGDAVATVAQFERLGQWLEQDSDLLLAADIGEMIMAGELPISDRLIRNLSQLACVYLCDRHSELTGDQPIGQGEVDLGRIRRALDRTSFRGHAVARVEGRCELGFASARRAIQILLSDVASS